jgi:glyoxylase-like metal-dependent hydrolase (beta-lactamase superfamily II)
MVYEDRQAGLAFTGDHILPRITPSIALERMPEKLPLRSYLASLRLFLDLPDAWMLPAHGAVTRSVRARVEELLDHHRHRLDLVQGLVTAGSHTAYDVSRQMLWTDRDPRGRSSPGPAGGPQSADARRIRPINHYAVAELHGGIGMPTERKPDRASALREERAQMLQFCSRLRSSSGRGPVDQTTGVQRTRTSA